MYSRSIRYGSGILAPSTSSISPNVNDEHEGMIEDGGSPEQSKDGGHNESPEETGDGGDTTPKDNEENADKQRENSSEKEGDKDNPEDKWD